MIPAPAMAAWRSRRPWRNDQQVAQDLFLAALAIEIARDETTGRALIWRGGTCLHQLHLPAPERYSDDLDYVLLAGSATYRDLDRAFARIAGILDAPLRGKPAHETERYKTFLTGTAAGGIVFEVKVEINTADVAPAFDLIFPRLEVDVPSWYTGGAAVATYQPAELVGTKFRALSQRRKGRDLWDLDLARRALSIPDDDLARGAAHYLTQARVSPAEFRSRLAEHVLTDEFLSDLDPLLARGIGDYDARAVARRVIVWADAFLDPLLPTHEQRRSRAVSGPELRCPEYTRIDGTPARCERLVPSGGCCRDHESLGTITGWQAGERTVVKRAHGGI